MDERTRVSIPFKRESVSKAYSKPLPPKYYWFQFPSNGKAYPKLGLVPRLAAPCVSIPFKRESVSKAFIFVSIVVGLIVSIPFKRESVSKAFVGPHRGHWPLNRGQRFNSLQTGKRIQSRDEVREAAQEALKFQFPSNGKAYPKGQCWRRRSCRRRVFQFPSNGKAYPKV